MVLTVVLIQLKSRIRTYNPSPQKKTVQKNKTKQKIKNKTNKQTKKKKKTVVPHHRFVHTLTTKADTQVALTKHFQSTLSSP